MAKKKKAPEELTNRELEIIVRQGEDYFDKEYVDYCMYVLENRALPSIIDGLKPGARKIIHSAFHILSENKKSNFMDLVGTTMSYAKYHHGDSSLLGTIKTLGTEYSDNLAPLKIIGSNGDLRSPEGAAPRYLHVKLSPYAKLLRKNEEILDYHYDGNTKVEPKYYLPIIPLILMSRTTGLGVGFSYTLGVSYNPVSVITECLNYLENGIILNDLVPHINQFNGSFVKKKNGSIYAKGLYSVNKNTITVNEFAPNVTYEDFEQNLASLYDKGYVVSYDNNSNDKIEYVIKVTTEFMTKYGKDSTKLEKQLMLGQLLRKPTLSILNEHGKLTEFSDVEEVLEYFVEFRAEKYATLKAHIIKVLQGKIMDAEMMRKFIDAFLTGQIALSKDVPVAETIKQMKKLGIPEEYIDTKMSKLTKEEYEKLGKHIAALKAELSTTENTEPKTMYINDLVDLKKSLEKDFPLSDFTIED